jgi:hypothetical protein
MSSLNCGPSGFDSAPLQGRTQEQFPDPFFDYASLAMPRTIREALRLIEFIVTSNGPYREALQRVVSYFVTDVEILAVPGDRLGAAEKEKYESFFSEVLDIRRHLIAAALDYITYGNVFLTVTVPFKRYLRATCGCGYEISFKEFVSNKDINFEWSGYEFHGRCLRCKKRFVWERIDRRSRSSEDLKLKKWNPHEMDIDYDLRTEDCQYIWRIPEDYRMQLRRGDLFQLERADWEILDVIKNNQDMLFEPESVLHLKEPSLSGIRHRGWGMSRVLTNFRHAWYYAVLHRYNEAIALDYIIPFRVITPAAKAGQTGESMDPVLSLNLGDFKAQVERMLRLRRSDPTRWNILPFPVQYQAIGGDASALAPKDLLEYALKVLLDAIGVPYELYTATLSAQAAPAALRLFEANWSHLIHALNSMLQYIADKAAGMMSWEPVVVRMKRVTHADDLNKQMAVLQLMMGGQISKSTGLSALNLDFLNEERAKLTEEKMVAEETAKMQKEMELQQIQQDLPNFMGQQAPMDPNAQQGAAQGAAQGGQMPMMQGMPGAIPGGGVPAPAAGLPGGQMPAGAAGSFAANAIPSANVPVTLQELTGQASQLAQQLMSLPESIRASELSRIRKQNDTLATLIAAEIKRLRRDAELRGREQILAQEYGGGQPA